MFSRKKDVAKISDKAPVFHVRYIGVTETFVANGRGCSYAPVQRLWDNAPDERYLRKVAVHLSQGGITMKDAEKKEELIGDFPIENISFCNVDRAVNERIFSWICRSSDDARLDCHAVLCSTKQKAQTMAVVLSRAFQIAYKDWKSHTRNREIDRTSAALSGHQKSGAGGSRGNEAGHDTGLNRVRDSGINSLSGSGLTSPSGSGLNSRRGSGLSSPTSSGGSGLNGHGISANGGVVGDVSGKTNNKGIPSPVPAPRSKKHTMKSLSPTISASRPAASPTGSTPSVSPNLTSSLVALSVSSESHRVRDAASSSSQLPPTTTQFASSCYVPPATSSNYGHPATSSNYGHPATSSNYGPRPSSSSYEYPTTSTRFMSSSILDPDVEDSIEGVDNLQAEYDMDSD